ncbi:MAG: hypothetical protein RI885_281 [Actinomycetota bacterium]|jgi:hypothetical protein
MESEATEAFSLTSFAASPFATVVLPQIAKLLLPGELAGVSLRVSPSDRELNVQDPPAGVRCTMTLLAVDEQFELDLFDSNVLETDDNLGSRVYEELQTWIAESTFGWGQLRK